MASYLAHNFPRTSASELEQMVRDRPLCVALTLLFAALANGSRAFYDINGALTSRQCDLLAQMLSSRFQGEDACMAASSDFIAHLDDDDIERIQSFMNVGQRDLLMLFVQIFSGHRGFAESLLELEYYPDGIRMNDGGPIEPSPEVAPSTESKPMRLSNPLRDMLARESDKLTGGGWKRVPERQAVAERLQASLLAPSHPPAPIPSIPRARLREEVMDIPITLARIGFDYEQMRALFEECKFDTTTLDAMQKLHAELVDQVSRTLEHDAS